MAALNGKVIAITGAASGIGLELAKLCAARGAKLAIADIQEEALQRAVTEIKASGTDIIGKKVNVASHKEVDDWINAAKSHFGRIDGAANVAGVEGKNGVFTNFVDVQNDEWDFIMSINLTGLMYCLRAELRVMESGASIVNMSSIAGLMGRPGIGPYSVSKHGVVGMTRTAAKEVGCRGIRVNAVAPGPVETPMLQRLLKNAAGSGQDQPVANTYKNLPLQRLGQSPEIAQAMAFLLSDEASYITGVIFPVDGGGTA